MRKRRRFGFSMVEMAFAILLAVILLGIVFEMFVKGNKTSSKATWRVHTLGWQRRGIRQIKAKLEASSYPTVIRIGDYREITDGYRLVFGDTASRDAVPGTSLTSYRFTEGDWIMKWYRCHPLEDIEFIDDGSTAGTRVGTATGVALQLVPSQGHTDLFELWFEEATADITFDPATNSPLIDDFGEATRTRLVADVSSVSILIPTTDPGGRVASGAVLEAIIECTDPFDKRMVLQEDCRMEVNVEMEFDPVGFETDETDPGF